MECVFCGETLHTKKELVEETCHRCAFQEEEKRKERDASRREQKGKRERWEDEDDDE